MKEEKWEIKFNNKFSLDGFKKGEFIKHGLYCKDLKDFIRSLLEQQKQEIIEKIRKEVIVYGSQANDFKEDIINLIKTI